MRRRPASFEEDIDRRIGGLIALGVVESVDEDGKAEVSLGDQRTPPIEWLMAVGDTTIWLRPTIGQQVMIACPDGDVEQAAIIGGLPSDDCPALPSGAQVVIRFKDGANLSYDPEASLLDFALTGAARLTAPDGLTIAADTSITGKLTVSGDIHGAAKVIGDVDVVAAGISGKSHKHPPGSPLSGPPQ